MWALRRIFLGLTGKIERVSHTKLLPLTEKWRVVTISTQYGCSMGCKFCDVPKVGPGFNFYIRDDLLGQIHIYRPTHGDTKTKRLNIHKPAWEGGRLGMRMCFSYPGRLYARKCLRFRFDEVLMPRSIHHDARAITKSLGEFPLRWMYLKNGYYQGMPDFKSRPSSTK